MEQTTYKSLCYHTQASLQHDRLMQLQDTQMQLENVEKRRMDTEKEEISINMSSMLTKMEMASKVCMGLHDGLC